MQQKAQSPVSVSNKSEDRIPPISKTPADGQPVKRIYLDGREQLVSLAWYNLHVAKFGSR